MSLKINNFPHCEYPQKVREHNCATNVSAQGQNYDRKNGINRTARFQTMAALYRSGQTLREIGIQFNCSGEYIRQCLRKIRVTPAEGGKQKSWQIRQEKFHASRDAQSLKRWGCNYDQYAVIRNLKKPTRAYVLQRKSARARGIGWEFNLWQWWTVWHESGKWDQRGCRQGCYVMCRKGDVGPYAVGNVYIATCTQNMLDYLSHKRSSSGGDLCSAS